MELLQNKKHSPYFDYLKATARNGHVKVPNYSDGP